MPKSRKFRSIPMAPELAIKLDRVAAALRTSGPKAVVSLIEAAHRELVASGSLTLPVEQPAPFLRARYWLADASLDTPEAEWQRVIRVGDLDTTMQAVIAVIRDRVRRLPPSDPRVAQAAGQVYAHAHAWPTPADVRRWFPGPADVE